MVAADSTDSVIAELAQLVGRKSVVRVRAATPADRVRLGWELLATAFSVVSPDFVCQILSLTPTCREASTASVFFVLNAATEVNLICSAIGIASFTLRHQAFTHGCGQSSGTASRGTRGVTTPLPPDPTDDHPRRCAGGSRKRSTMATMCSKTTLLRGCERGGACRHKLGAAAAASGKVVQACR